MKAFLFTCSSRPQIKAASTSETGANLPDAACGGGTWKPSGHLDLSLPGGSPAKPVDVAAIQEALSRHGHYVFEDGLDDPIDKAGRLF